MRKLYYKGFRTITPKRDDHSLTPRTVDDYHVRGMASGSFEVIDKLTSKPVAQVDTREEAASWIAENASANRS